jgi:FKBP-type peptidyl-prolyl cis-trans isomerase SlyD
MEIHNDCCVVLEYTLRLDDGSYVRGDPAGGVASLNFIAGYDQILPGLEHRLLGLTEGSITSFTIRAAEAFGEHSPQLVRERSYDDFPEGRSLEPGRWVAATNERTGARYVYRVVEKTAAGVRLDFNHPLAGKDLHYHVRIVKVRAALPEELVEVRPCESPAAVADDCAPGA